MTLVAFPEAGVTTSQNIQQPQVEQQKQQEQQPQSQQSQSERPLDRNAPDVVHVRTSTYGSGEDKSISYNIRANAPMAGKESTTASGSINLDFAQRHYGQTPQQYALAEAQRQFPGRTIIIDDVVAYRAPQTAEQQANIQSGLSFQAARQAEKIQHEEQQRVGLENIKGAVATGEIRGSPGAIQQLRSEGYKVAPLAESLSQMTPDKAFAIQKMLENPTAQFAPGQIQRGYDIVQFNKPEFKPEQVKATEISRIVPAEKQLEQMKFEEVPVSKEFKLGFEAPKFNLMEDIQKYKAEHPTPESVKITPTIISGMRGVEAGKVDVGKQMEKISFAEEKLKSFDPLIKNDKFTGTNTQYIEYQKAYDTYNKENKVLEDVYKSREKESLSTGLLQWTQRTSKGLQEDVDKFLGTTKSGDITIKRFVSQGASVITGLPSFVGQSAFSGEQIVRHPSEIVAAAKVGVPLFLSQTKESAIQDPIGFAGSLVGMIALGKAGKVTEGIKNIKFEEASGIRSLREVTPKLEPSSRVSDLTAGMERVGEIKSDLSKPTSRMESLESAKEVLGEARTRISEELTKTTRGSEALKALGLGEQTTRGKSLESAKQVLEEQKAKISQALSDVQKLVGREFSRPTRGTEALTSAREIITETGKRGAYRPEIKGLEPESAGVRYLFGGQEYIEPTTIFEPKVAIGEKHYQLAPEVEKAPIGIERTKALSEYVKSQPIKLPGEKVSPEDFTLTHKSDIPLPKTLTVGRGREVYARDQPGLYAAPKGTTIKESFGGQEGEISYNPLELVSGLFKPRREPTISVIKGGKLVEIPEETLKSLEATKTFIESNKRVGRTIETESGQKIKIPEEKFVEKVNNEWTVKKDQSSGEFIRKVDQKTGKITDRIEKYIERQTKPGEVIPTHKFYQEGAEPEFTYAPGTTFEEVGTKFATEIKGQRFLVSQKRVVKPENIITDPITGERSVRLSSGEIKPLKELSSVKTIEEIAREGEYTPKKVAPKFLAGTTRYKPEPKQIESYKPEKKYPSKEEYKYSTKESGYYPSIDTSKYAYPTKEEKYYPTEKQAEYHYPLKTEKYYPVETPKYSPEAPKYPSKYPIQYPTPKYPYPSPYLDRYISDLYYNPAQSEIPVDYPSFDEKETGKRQKGKQKPKRIVTYKPRASPIFEGAEKLFEDNPIKTKKPKITKKSKKQFWEQ